MLIKASFEKTICIDVEIPDTVVDDGDWDTIVDHIRDAGAFEQAEEWLDDQNLVLYHVADEYDNELIDCGHSGYLRGI